MGIYCPHPEPSTDPMTPSESTAVLLAKSPAVQTASGPAELIIQAGAVRWFIFFPGNGAGAGFWVRDFWLPAEQYVQRPAVGE